MSQNDFPPKLISCLGSFEWCNFTFRERNNEVLMAVVSLNSDHLAFLFLLLFCCCFGLNLRWQFYVLKEHYILKLSMYLLNLSRSTCCPLSFEIVSLLNKRRLHAHSPLFHFCRLYNFGSYISTFVSFFCYSLEFFSSTN